VKGVSYVDDDVPFIVFSPDQPTPAIEWTKICPSTTPFLALYTPGIRLLRPTSSSDLGGETWASSGPTLTSLFFGLGSRYPANKTAIYSLLEVNISSGSKRCSRTRADWLDGTELSTGTKVEACDGTHVLRQPMSSGPHSGRGMTRVSSSVSPRDEAGSSVPVFYDVVAQAVGAL
jgi:hypothetical protein